MGWWVVGGERGEGGGGGEEGGGEEIGGKSVGMSGECWRPGGSFSFLFSEGEAFVGEETLCCCCCCSSLGGVRESSFEESFEESLEEEIFCSTSFPESLSLLRLDLVLWVLGRGEVVSSLLGDSWEISLFSPFLIERVLACFFFLLVFSILLVCSLRGSVEDGRGREGRQKKKKSPETKKTQKRTKQTKKSKNEKKMYEKTIQMIF